MTDTEVQPAPEAAAGNDDVRAIVAAAYEQHSKPAEPETPEPAAAEGEDRETTARARNERGQFAPKAETGTPVEAQPVSDADPIADTLEQPSTAIEPPTSWSADAKAEWSKLSPALQQAVIKREAEINDGGRRWSEEKRTYEDMLAPVREQARRAGVDEREGLNRLLAASDFLERDPANAIQWLARQYGVNLAQQPGETGAPVQALPREVLNTMQTVTTLQQRLDAREFADAAAAIQSFASQPGREHFEAVKADMGRLIETGQARDMADAYDKAVWMNPEIRSQLVAAQTAKASADRRAQDVAIADRARKAALSISGSPAGAGAPIAKPEYDTVEAAVRAAFAQHSSH